MKLREIIIEDNPQNVDDADVQARNPDGPNEEPGQTELQQNNDQPLKQETGGYTVNPRVKKLQTQLQKLGYDLGRAGVDGKYGPRTASAVSSFKKDYKISGSGKIAGTGVFTTLDKIGSGAIKKKKPTPSKKVQQSSGISGLDPLPNIPEVQQAKQVAERFLGSEMSDDEFNMLFRASIAEASPHPKERAGVMAVMLNRVKSSRYPNSIKDVLEQKNQFQAVTGTENNGRKPSSNYTKTPSERHARSLSNAIIQGLPSANSSWLNFTSAISGAYGAGTNIGFMRKVANSKGSRRIGDTWFGTV